MSGATQRTSTLLLFKNTRKTLRSVTSRYVCVCACRLTRRFICRLLISVEEIPDKNSIVMRTGDYLELIELQSEYPP